MSSTNGYSFYFDNGSKVVTLPITPGELSITVDSRNEVVNLINEGEINILKSPSLTEISFDARFPMRKYPYSKTHESFKSYYDFFKVLKRDKKSFRFIVARTTPGGKRTWDTNLLMSLETFELNESADEGDDVIVSFTLKEYKPYSIKTLPVSAYGVKKSTSTSKNSRDSGSNGTTSSKYTVKKGDCLWKIAKKFYGNGSKWTIIYNANKDIIESTAKKRGLKSSSNGHWIFPGTVLTIPGISNPTSSTSTSSSSGKTTSSGTTSYSTGKSTSTKKSTSSSSSTKSSSSSSSTKTSTKQLKYIVNISGTKSYAGSLSITYYYKGKYYKKSLSSTAYQHTISADVNTAVKLTITPKSGYGYRLSSIGIPLGGTKSYGYARTITASLRDSNIVVSIGWIKTSGATRTF